MRYGSINHSLRGEPKLPVPSSAPPHFHFYLRETQRKPPHSLQLPAPALDAWEPAISEDEGSRSS